MRSSAREAVFKYLFTRLFNQNDEGLFGVFTKDLSKSDRSFAEKLFSEIDSSYEKYNEKLSELTQNFRSSRIFTADRCAIILGMAEGSAFPETDKAVIIDEAVNLAVRFSTEKSADFVNGILAAYFNDRDN